MTLDFSLPPSLRPLIRNDVLAWARAAASGTKTPSELKDEGLRFLEEWEHLRPEDRKVVGEITDALFGMEDMGESFEDVQRVAQAVLQDAPVVLDELAGVVPEALVERPLIDALASFAFSKEWMVIERYELLTSYMRNRSEEARGVNRGLADEGLRILEAIREQKMGIVEGKWAIVWLLACLNPAFLKKSPFTVALPA